VATVKRITIEIAMGHDAIHLRHGLEILLQSRLAEACTSPKRHGLHAQLFGQGLSQLLVGDQPISSAILPEQAHRAAAAARLGSPPIDHR
jgi:hypothetical protein